VLSRSFGWIGYEDYHDTRTGQSRRGLLEFLEQIDTYPSILHPQRGHLPSTISPGSTSIRSLPCDVVLVSRVFLPAR
jgi:hypothetical protein